MMHDCLVMTVDVELNSSQRRAHENRLLESGASRQGWLTRQASYLLLLDWSADGQPPAIHYAYGYG